MIEDAVRSERRLRRRRSSNICAHSCGEARAMRSAINVPSVSRFVLMLASLFYDTLVRRAAKLNIGACDGARCIA